MLRTFDEIYWGIRDPFDRIVSCYFNKFIWYDGKRLNENNLECFSKKFLRKTGIDYENLTFNKFLYGIQDLICKKQHINHHFNSQVNLKNWAIDNPINVKAGTSVKPGLLKCSTC